MKKFGFSWKRATGITNVKRKISKATGIPTTKQGRKNKMRRLATGGCLLPLLTWSAMLLFVLYFIISLLA